MGCALFGSLSREGPHDMPFLLSAAVNALMARAKGGRLFKR
jgi:hypothetical protein